MLPSYPTAAELYFTGETRLTELVKRRTIGNVFDNFIYHNVSVSGGVRTNSQKSWSGCANECLRSVTSPVTYRSLRVTLGAQNLLLHLLPRVIILCYLRGTRNAFFYGCYDRGAHRFFSEVPRFGSSRPFPNAYLEENQNCYHAG